MRKKKNVYFPIPTFRAWHCGVWKQKQPPLKRQQVRRMQRRDNEGISREEFKGKRYAVRALSFDNNIERDWSFRRDEKVDQIKRYTEMYE